MQEKINIIQFLPYFPPHKGGLETVAEEIWKYWVKNNFWDFINIVTEFEQEKELKNNEKIIFEWEIIWYKKAWVEVLVCPSIELINNFPVYKFWDKKYKIIKKYIKNKIWENKDNFRIITHTRFFLTSLFWWIFARKNKIKWIHIEHWSDYVKLSSKFKSFIAFVYDKIFWKWIFKNADLVIPISNACKNFVEKLWWKKVKLWPVIYRWINLKELNLEKKLNLKLSFIWRLVKLKWVDDLLKAYKNLNLDIKLEIIWDWEEKEKLEKFAKENNLNIEFLGFKNKDFIEKYLAENKVILINPSYQEWLPTTVIEWLFYKNIVIASNVGWTSEISDKEDLILFEAWNISELEKKIKYWIENYEKLVWKSFEIIKNKFNWKKNIEKYYLEIKKLENL